MRYSRRLGVLCLLACLAITGVSQTLQNNDFFSKFPTETVFSISESVSAFTSIVCEVPGGNIDTIWVENLVQPPMWKIQANIEDENINVISQGKEGKRASLKNVSYPLDAVKKGKEGRVEATCIVEEDGSLTDIRIVNSVFPSIDAEAVRLLSEARLLPCKVCDRPIRCRHKVALLFEIIDKKAKYGRVLVVNTENLSDGVSKKYQFGVRWTQTTTETKTNKYGERDSRSWTSGSWHTELDIDVPKDNPEFEKMLCEILYSKSGKSIETVGPKFAKSFKGKIKNEDFKGVKGNDLLIVARCLSYKAGKYYSYGYETTLKEFSVRHSIAHNFIYDIQAKRLLTIDDIFTEEFMKSIGLEAEEKYDLGMNDLFLYVGKNKKNIATIAISQENWHKFSPMFQSLLGSKGSFPVSVNKVDYLYESNLGIQPTGIKRKVLDRPSLIANSEDFYYYINRNLVIPESILESRKSVKAVLSFIVERNGTLSNMEIVQSDGGTDLRDELKRIVDTMPECKPLTLSGKKVVRSYFMLEYNLSFKKSSRK